ncbi:MAG: 6-phosphofructokinase [Candidatus Omnitrophica bacterium]|nr:6-phosphofructokinase [Candidatus Omnitrophota bacterium]
MVVRSSHLKRIAVLTSGGDSPGLNACLRAIVRTALTHHLEIFGIRRGFKGLISGDLIPLDGRSVSGVINRGGTFLLTARDKEFRTGKGIKKACLVLAKHRMGGLIVLGGNGSLQGAWELSQKTSTAVMGVPKSIDNDVGGTDFSIGFDTAVNTAVEVIDRIRDTATSHERLFLVETMGRKRGFLALATAIAGGAESVLLPELSSDIPSLCRKLAEAKRHGKVSSIVVVAEGDESGGAFKIAKRIQRSAKGYDVRVSVIGHQQRGGAPSAFDRILASQFGTAAVEALIRGERTKLVGIQGGKLTLSPLESAWKIEKPLDPNLLRLSEILSS